MANLTTRNEPSISSLIPDLGYQFDPFQTMREMLRWDPINDLYRGWPSERVGITFNPMFDVRETNDAFILQADMPGMVEKDLDISLTNNRLVVSGKRENEQEVKGETYYRSERTWGSFSRSFNLPSDVDANKVTAELKSGVLYVNLPKTGDSMARKITIHAEKK
jgi:HSP20 family protein